MLKKSDKLAKASLARINGVVAGTTTTVDARVSPLSQSLGITYDANHNVLSNQTDSRITTLESQVATLQAQVTALLTHTHNYTDNDTSMVTGVPN